MSEKRPPDEPGHPHPHEQPDLTREDRDRSAGPEHGDVRDDDDKLDKEGMDSFPASDPPAHHQTD